MFQNPEHPRHLEVVRSQQSRGTGVVLRSQVSPARPLRRRQEGGTQGRHQGNRRHVQHRATRVDPTNALSVVQPGLELRQSRHQLGVQVPRRREPVAHRPAQH